MGIIDWPSPYVSNTAFFKATVSLPNRRGGTRRIHIPKIESEVLDIQSGDRLSVEMYDHSTDTQVSFDTTAREGSSRDDIRFTMPLRELDLEPNEFDSSTFVQVVLIKTTRFLPIISPKRIYNIALYKRSPAIELNPESRQPSTLRMTIPQSQSIPLDMSRGDKIYVTLIRINLSDKVIDGIMESLSSVNRSAFRASVVEPKPDDPVSVAFNIPAKRRRIKEYEKDDIFQVALRKV